jgi:hypothetical protein
MSEGLEIDQIEVYWSIDIDITKLASGVSCSYKCIIINDRSYVILKFDRKSDQPVVYAFRLFNKVE